jgi:hypothetical protein
VVLAGLGVLSTVLMLTRDRQRDHLTAAIDPACAVSDGSCLACTTA